MSPSTQGPGRSNGRGSSHQHSAAHGNAGHHDGRPPVRRPLPAEVYRRRRIVLAIGTVIVVALFVVGISLLVGGLKHQEKVTAKPGTTVTPAAATSTTAQAPKPDKNQAAGMCDAKSITVGAATDKKTYDVGAKVEMTLTVTNKSGESCNISAGPKAQEFVVKQGDKIEWSSKYCQSASETDADVQFTAGESKPSKLTWDMAPADKNCKPTADNLEPGTYQLVTKLGDKSSNPVEFTVKGEEKAKDDKAKDDKAKKD